MHSPGTGGSSQICSTSFWFETRWNPRHWKVWWVHPPQQPFSAGVLKDPTWCIPKPLSKIICTCLFLDFCTCQMCWLIFGHKANGCSWKNIGECDMAEYLQTLFTSFKAHLRSCRSQAMSNCSCCQSGPGRLCSVLSWLKRIYSHLNHLKQIHMSNQKQPKVKRCVWPKKNMKKHHTDAIQPVLLLEVSKLHMGTWQFEGTSTEHP